MPEYIIERDTPEVGRSTAEQLRELLTWLE
jgi:hypothetical protein